MDTWTQITDWLAQIGSEDPAIRGGVLVGTGALALTTLGRSVYGWARRKPLKREERVEATISAPAGTEIEFRASGK